jgi:hypothetical protein
MPVCTSRAQRTVDHAAELDNRAVSGALDDAAVMGGDRGVDEVAAEAAETRERPVFVGAGEPGIADDIRDHNRRELPRLAHCALPAAGRTAQNYQPDSGLLCGLEKVNARRTCARESTGFAAAPPRAAHIVKGD